MRVCNALILWRTTTTTSSLSSKPFTFALYPNSFFRLWNSFSATIIIAAHSGCCYCRCFCSLFYCISKLIQHFSLSFGLLLGYWFNKFAVGVTFVLSRPCHFLSFMTQRSASPSARVQPATERQKWSNTKCVCMVTISIQYFMSACARICLFEKVLFIRPLYHLPPVFFIIYFHWQLFLFSRSLLLRIVFLSVWILTIPPMPMLHQISANTVTHTHTEFY